MSLKVKTNVKGMSIITNRSYKQSLELYALLGWSLELLVELEAKIKENNIFYCPSTEEEAYKILMISFNN